MTEFSADYRRRYGVHTFEDKQGRAIGVFSAPYWQSLAAFMRLSGAITSDIVITPELITLPGSLATLPTDSAAVHKRIIDAQVLSARNPSVTWLLGTPTMPEPTPLQPALRPTPEEHADSSDTQRPRNSLVAIKDMVRIGAIHKQRIFHAVERDVLQSSLMAEAQKVPGYADVEALVCSDLMYAMISLSSVARRPDRDQYVSEKASTVLVSACWEVPNEDRVPNEAMSQDQLETAAARIFDERPNVQDIIMADRNVPGSDNKGPFNVHFQRA